MKQLQIKIVLKINVLAHACLWGLRTSPALDCSGQKLGWSKLKVWGVRSRTGKCTINADAVRTEDRNFWRGAGRGQKFSARDISIAQLNIDHEFVGERSHFYIMLTTPRGYL